MRPASVVLDIALAVSLAVWAALDAAHDSTGEQYPDFPHPGVGPTVLMAVAGLALVVRRVLPLLSTALSLGALLSVSLVWGHYQAGITVIIGAVAAYSAAAYSPHLRAVVGICVAFAIGFTAIGAGDEDFATILTGLVFVGVVLGAGVAVGVVVRRARLRAELERRAADDAVLNAEEQASGAAEAAAAEERARIARELHDILAHGLGVVVLQTGAAEHALAHDPDRARESIVAARTTAEQAIAQLRTLVSVVREPSASDLGGTTPQPTLSDLPALVAESSSPGFDVRYAEEGSHDVAPAQVQTSVYRIVQEAIANAIKHSRATDCDVRVQCDSDAVLVEVTDNGTGGPPGPGSRLGLVGVEERVAVYGGRLDVGPRPDGGWSVRATIPVPS